MYISEYRGKAILEIPIENVNHLKRLFNNFPSWIGTRTDRRSIEDFRQLLNTKREYCCAEFWTTDDVMSQQNDRGEKFMGVRKARDIMKQMEHHHDCNAGITWDTIDCYIDEMLEKEE